MHLYCSLVGRDAFSCGLDARVYFQKPRLIGLQKRRVLMNQNEQKLRDALFSIKCKAEHEYKCTNSTGFSDIQATAEQALAHVNETPKKRTWQR